jgi:hypothetical protein
LTIYPQQEGFTQSKQILGQGTFVFLLDFFFLVAYFKKNDYQQISNCYIVVNEVVA